METGAGRILEVVRRGWEVRGTIDDNAPGKLPALEEEDRFHAIS